MKQEGVYSSSTTPSPFLQFRSQYYYLYIKTSGPAEWENNTFWLHNYFSVLIKYQGRAYFFIHFYSNPKTYQYIITNSRNHDPFMLLYYNFFLLRTCNKNLYSAQHAKNLYTVMFLQDLIKNYNHNQKGNKNLVLLWIFCFDTHQYFNDDVTNDAYIR